MNKGAILLVEDDRNLGFVIKDNLIETGYRVDLAPDGQAGWELFQVGTYDLCILDVMMPKMDGFELTSKIRKKDEFVPIIFLTARNMEEDRLRGFEIGGDDYVTKPFSIKELMYRIDVFMRRSSSSLKPEKAPRQSRVGSYEFDMANLRLSIGSKQVHLTQMEGQLLEMLMANRNELVKREDILVRIWGENDYFKGRSLDVFISRLRKYLSEDASITIQNHHGVGFTLLCSD